MVSNEQFVRVFMEAHVNRRGSRWIANKTHSSPKGISDKASRLRKLGVRLPYLSPPRPQDHVNPEALNKIIERYPHG